MYDTYKIPDLGKGGTIALFSIGISTLIAVGYAAYTILTKDNASTIPESMSPEKMYMALGQVQHIMLSLPFLESITRVYHINDISLGLEDKLHQ